MSNSGKKLFGMIVCDSQAKWGGPEGIAKRIENVTGLKDQEWKMFVAEQGEFPSDEELKTFQGFYITGSHHSINDDSLQWIEQLEHFVQSAYELNKPKVYGGCFGHQVIAKALGGKVGKNPSKCFVCYNEEIILSECENSSKFLNDLKEICGKQPLRILESHGECVEELPPNAKSVASSKSCKNEIILFSDHIIGVQAHADFKEEDLTDVILPSVLKKGIISQTEFNYAHETLKQDNHGPEMSKAVGKFLNS